MKSADNYGDTAAGTDAKWRTPVRVVLISCVMVVVVNLFRAEIICAAIPVLTWQ
jgi:hypothetical protein